MVSNVDHNRAHFDDQAATYNKRHETGIKQLTEDIQAHRDWIGLELNDENEDQGARTSAWGKPQVRILDYACGTGLVSHALAPYAAQFVGIDLSENMVKEYNTRAQTESIPASRMYAHHGNLMEPEEPAQFDGPDFFGFDLAVVGLGFHHLDDPALASKRLARRLKPSGKLMIIDNLAPDHTGFSRESVKAMFEDAGVGTGFDFVVLSRPLLLGKGDHAWEQRVFMAKGTKSSREEQN